MAKTIPIKNHSAKFYEEVEKVFPNTKSATNGLTVTRGNIRAGSWGKSTDFGSFLNATLTQQAGQVCIHSRKTSFSNYDDLQLVYNFFRRFFDACWWNISPNPLPESEKISKYSLRATPLWLEIFVFFCLFPKPYPTKVIRFTDQWKINFILIKIHFNLIILMKMIKLSLTKNNLSLII